MLPPDTNFDAIVIGGGHNGLVAAAYLGKAGRRVLLLEASDALGGPLATNEITPGYRISTTAHLVDIFPRRIEKELKLAKHGLRYAARALPIIALNPTNGHLVLSRRRRDVDALRKKSARDGDAYVAFAKRMRSHASMLAPLLDEAPPLGDDARAAFRALVWRGERLRSASLEALMRDMPGSIGDLLDNLFETPFLKGALALDALLGSPNGPFDEGTVLRGAYRKARRLGGSGSSIPEGGLGAFVGALARAATGFGVTMKLSSPVVRILVENDVAAGVETASGEIFRASLVLSSADPGTTMLDLLGARHLDAGLASSLARKSDGIATAKLNLALDGLPTFQGLAPAEYGARLLVAPSLGDLQDAFAAARRGAVAVNPVMEVTIPSVADPTLTPPSHHVMSILVQYVPVDAADGWERERGHLVDRVIETLSVYAPDLRQRIVAGALLLPRDLERRYGLPGGGWHHGDMRADRLLMLRPEPALARYRTPVAGLFLCGAGSHPGGGISGMAGKLAAKAALGEGRRA